MSRDVVVVGIARTPMARKNRELAAAHPIDMLAAVFHSVIERSRVDPKYVGDVLVGCVSQLGDQSLNIGRQALLTAGLPMVTPAATINMVCGSSQRALQIADALIRSGMQRMVMVAGVESMRHNPLDIDQQLPEGCIGPYPPSYRNIYEPTHQGEAAERIADKWEISREEIDAFAARSHQRAYAAIGTLQAEITPVSLQDGSVISGDTTIRGDASPEVISELRPVFRVDGRLSAGSSSQVVDGAAALLLASRETAKSFSLPIMATILDHVILGSDPILMLTGPIYATRALLTKNGVAASALDWYEVNEAFASIPLAWQRELEVSHNRINPNGGAIALGHPLGASGARLVVTMINGLYQRGGGRGVSTMCVGGGIGTATLLEV